MKTKFGEGLTSAQIKLAREFERANVCSYSQAIKAFQRRENEKITAWKKELEKHN